VRKGLRRGEDDPQFLEKTRQTREERETISSLSAGTEKKGREGSQDRPKLLELVLDGGSVMQKKKNRDGR